MAYRLGGGRSIRLSYEGWPPHGAMSRCYAAVPVAPAGGTRFPTGCLLRSIPDARYDVRHTGKGGPGDTVTRGVGRRAIALAALALAASACGGRSHPEASRAGSGLGSGGLSRLRAVREHRSSTADDAAADTVTSERTVFPWTEITLTSDGDDHFEVEPDGDGFVASAPTTNHHRNLRVLLLPAGEHTIDHQICSTWSSEVGPIAQHGLAVNVNETSPGHYRAVTITKNILYGESWLINVHGWEDSAGNKVGYGLGHRSMTVMKDVPLPWRVCARTTGPRLDVKVWAQRQPEPSWADPLHTLSVALPPRLAGAGQAAWFVGHLGPGDFLRVTDTVTWGRPRDSWPSDRLRSLGM